MEKEDKSLISFIWKHHLVIYLSLLIIGLYFDFIHLSISGVGRDNWFGFRYVIDVNFTVIIDIFKDGYNDFIQMIKEGFKSFKEEIYK